MNKEFLAKKKEIKALETDVKALEATDERIWTNLDTINKTASTAKIKAEEGVAKADDALTRASSNTTSINSLRTDVKALDATDERIWTNLDTINRTASTAKIKAEEGVAKADSALARNVFTDEEKAKLASITNPIIIKGRVDTVNDLPTEAVVGWFYFVGLESASSYKEYCYSENGWEYIGLSQEGVDLSNYYTKAQVDSKEQTLIGDIQGNAAAIEILNRDVSDSVAGIYSEITSVKNTISPLQDNVSALIDEKNIIGSRLTTVENTLNNVKTTAETAETKADNALTQADSNTTNINTLKTDVNALKSVDESIWTNLDTINKTASTAKTKAEEGVAKADDALTATRTNATNISTHETRLDSIDNTLSSHDTRITTAQQKANSVDEKVDSTNEVVGQLSTSLQSAYNKINAHANDIAINRTTLGTQCKNLLKNTAVTKTVNGVTITVNDNKSITVNGTATSAGVYAAIGEADVIAGNKYILNGGVGSSTTYGLYTENFGTVHNFGSDNVYIPNATGKAVFRIFIRPGVTISNITFKPMLRDADIIDNTYEPYKESIDERIIQNKYDIAVNKSTLGTQCKNLLKNTASTTTVNNVTFTVNSDGSITATQTTTSTGNATIKVATMTLKPGTYILTGDDEIKKSGFGEIRFYVGSTVYSANTAHTFDTEVTITVRIFIWSGVNINGSKTIYPMLRYADITDDTYEPYKESVDERLIENKSNIAINKSTLGYQCKNILNETEYLSSIASVSIGTFNISGNSITLTATGKDCYTKPHTSSDGGYRIPVEPDTNYILSWESDNTYAGLVYVFMNGSTSSYKNANNDGSKRLKFTTKSDTTFITIRLGVATSGNSITYSNIMLRYADIIDDTYKPYQPNLQEQTPYSISVSGKSTSAAISYSGVPTLICLTPKTADSAEGGLYIINSAGAVIKLINQVGIVIAADAASNTFTITNNTTTVMDVCVSRCWGR